MLVIFFNITQFVLYYKYFRSIEKNISYSLLIIGYMFVMDFICMYSIVISLNIIGYSHAIFLVIVVNRTFSQ